MNPFNKTPQIEYMCLWRRKPKTKPRKGHKRLSFSDQYRFEGYVEVDGMRHRVAFTPYDAIWSLLGGQLASKTAMVELYAHYKEGLVLEQRDLFSPFIAQSEGRIGVPAVVTREQYFWQPYAVMSVVDRKTEDGKPVVDMEIDFYAIELESEQVVKLLSLTTEWGQIACFKGQKRRWVWQSYGIKQRAEAA